MDNFTDKKYRIKKSSKAKNIRITIERDGSVVLTKPPFVSNMTAVSFLRSKWSWVLKKLKSLEARVQDPDIKRYDRKHYLENKEIARKLVTEKVECWNKMYGFDIKKIAVRSQKERWGSCSSLGNLNFNYKIIFLPNDLQDYIVVHEICHLKELNHSPRFWTLVAKAIPGYLDCKRALKNYS